MNLEGDGPNYRGVNGYHGRNGSNLETQKKDELREDLT
jgi:hypothetical protein